MKKQKEKIQTTQTLSQTAVTGTGNYKPDFRYALVAAFAGFLLYCGTMGYGYVLDDELVIKQNRYVQQGLKGIAGLFTENSSQYQDIRLSEYYRPLSLITFAVEQQLSPNNPALSHFDNVILYALTGFFLCLLLMRIFPGAPPVFSLIVSLLFLAHPLHTEVVANIKGRDEILSFLLMIPAVHTALLAYRQKPGNFKLLFVSCFLFYLSLLSKETSASAIFILPVLLLYTKRFGWKEIAIRSLPFLMVLIVFQLQKYVIAGHAIVSEVKDVVNNPYLETTNVLPTLLMILFRSVKLIFIPYPLAYSYAYNQLPSANWYSPASIAGLSLALLFCFVLLKYVRLRSFFALGILLSGICMLPVLGLIGLKGEMLAERFLYSPVLGFSIMLASLLFRFAENPVNTAKTRDLFSAKSLILTLPTMLLLGLYATGTEIRNSNWRSNEALFSHDIQVVPNSCQAHFHYGTEIVETGIVSRNAKVRNNSLRLGKEQLLQALQIYPHYAAAYATLGEANQKLANNYDSAIYYYNRALQEGSDDPQCYYGMGQCYELLGKQEMASYYYYSGIKRHPNNSYGIALFEQHRKKTGLLVKDFPSASNIDSTEHNVSGKGFDYYNQMGLKYGQNGDYANGARCLRKAISLNPAAQQSYINLSLCLCGLKDYMGAVDVLKQALQLNPQNVQTLSNLAAIYEHLDDHKNAQLCRDKISEIKRL